LSINITQRINFIYFTDANTGYIAGENYGIFKTTNAGISWSKLEYTNNINLLNSGYFTDVNTMFFVNDNNQVIKISKAGTTWTKFHKKNKKNNFDDPSLGRAIGEIIVLLIDAIARGL